MSLHFGASVEFIGGPIDGHVDEVAVPLQPFLGVSTLPKSAHHAPTSVFVALKSWLRGCHAGERIRLAIYELDSQEGSRTRYRFLRSQNVAVREGPVDDSTKGAAKYSAPS